LSFSQVSNGHTQSLKASLKLWANPASHLGGLSEYYPSLQLSRYNKAMVNFGITPPDSGLLTVLKPLGKPISLKVGEVVKARIIDVLPGGGITLKIKGSVLTARADMQFMKDISVFFKVLGSDRPGGELRLQYAGEAEGEPIPAQNNAPGSDSIARLLQNLSSVLTKAGPAQDHIVDLAEQLLKALPPDVKALPQQMRLQLQVLIQDHLKGSMEGLVSRLDQLIKELPRNIPGRDQLMDTLKVFQREIADSSPQIDHLQLKEALTGTGVNLEARLKALVIGARSVSSADISDVKTDLKAQLLQLKETLAESRTTSTDLVKGLLKDIETFQLISKVTDSFHTFLPMLWDSIKKGDISFRKSARSGSPCPYSCRINLDLAEFGQLNVIVVMSNMEFFVYFRADNDDFRETLSSSLDELGKRFSASGLSLKGTLFLEKDTLPSALESLEAIDGKVNIRI